MELLVKQLYLAREVTVNGPCSGRFTTIHGIPCYHHIRLLKELNRKATKLASVVYYYKLLSRLVL
jgi:hypothetical protein